MTATIKILLYGLVLMFPGLLCAAQHTSPSTTNAPNFIVQRDLSRNVDISQNITLPGVAKSDLSNTAGKLQRLSNGDAQGALVIGDGSNPVCNEQKTLKIYIATCPPWNVPNDGITDGTRALQALINALPDESVIFVPPGSGVVLSSTVTISDRVGVTIRSFNTVIHDGGSTAPQFIWNANGGIMFAIKHSDHVVFDGLKFRVVNPKIIDRFLDFGYSGGTHPGTHNIVKNSSFNAGVWSTNSSFVGIAIADPPVVNNENYIIDNVSIYCSGSHTATRSHAGSITNASTNLTCVDCAFAPGDVGQRVLVTYATGSLETIIASVSDSTHAVMAAAATSTQSNVTVQTGQSYGTGILNGNSANAKHQEFTHVAIGYCSRGIDIESGSFIIENFHNGGFNDVDIHITNTSEPSQIIDLETENSIRGIEISNNDSPLTVLGWRAMNAGQRADGFGLLRGRVQFHAARVYYAPPRNGVVFADAGNAQASFYDSNLSADVGLTYAQLGFSTMNNGVPVIVNAYVGGSGAAPNYGSNFQAVTMASPTIKTGVAQGSGLKHQRWSTGACDTSGCEVTLRWTSAFADANYTVTCSVEDSTTQSESAGLRVAKVKNHTAATVLIDLDNLSRTSATGIIHCIGMHD